MKVINMITDEEINFGGAVIESVLLLGDEIQIEDKSYTVQKRRAEKVMLSLGKYIFELVIYVEPSGGKYVLS